MVNSKNNLKTSDRTDYEIMIDIKNGSVDAKLEMFNRYHLLILKMRNDFNKRKAKLKDFGYGLDSSNYENDCYEYFERALNYIDIAKIPKNKITTWKAYIAFRQYLSVYNRDVIAKYIRIHKSEIPLDFDIRSHNIIKTASFDEISAVSERSKMSYEPDSMYEKRSNTKALRAAINICYNKLFSNLQRNIWDTKASTKYTIAEICKINNCNPRQYKQELSNMKKTLKSEYLKILMPTGAEPMYFN